MTPGERAMQRAAAVERKTRRDIERIRREMNAEDCRKIDYINAELDKPEREEDRDSLRTTRTHIVRRYLKEGRA